MLFNWAILVLNDKVKGKGINGNLRHIYWEKNNAVGRSATSNQNVASFLLCSTGVLQLSLPPCSSGLTCESTFRNTGGHTHTHIKVNYQPVEMGLKLGILCVLIASWDRNSQRLKHINIWIPPRHCWSTAVNKLVGYVKPPNQRTFGTPAE